MNLARPLILSLLIAGPAVAEADPRVRVVDFDDAAVVRVDGCFGYQTMIEFEAGDPIENVGLGEASQWLVTPNRSGDLLFVKPAQRSTRSNMTVATARRRYAFELVAATSAACARGDVVYRLRFRYPHEPAAAATPTPPPGLDALAPPETRNLAYTFTGSAETVPVRVFDNGSRTYFRWAEGASTPAVYARGPDEAETAVSFSAQGDYLVTDQVAPAFVLRRGNAVAVLYNDAYQTPALDAGSPQPRVEAPRAGLRWPFGRERTQP